MNLSGRDVAFAPIYMNPERKQHRFQTGSSEIQCAVQIEQRQRENYRFHDINEREVTLTFHNLDLVGYVC